MDTIFLKLIDGARVKNHLGLVMDEGKEAMRGKNYLYLDIPARKVPEEIKRNQHVFLEAAGTIDVKGKNVIEVEANPELAEYGTVQGNVRHHPDSGKKQLGVWFTAHKALDVTKLQYLVRIYMYS